MKVLALVVGMVLGVACTGDPSRGPVDAAPPPSSGELPVCDAMPGPAPEGFVLRKSRRITEADHAGTRNELGDPDGRLLVYLLGVSGEVGEGAETVQDMELADGTAAQLLGGGGSWILRWSDPFPCTQVAVVGNGFTRDSFLATMESTGLIAEE